MLSATIRDNWTNFLREVELIEHAKKTISAPTPMEIDSFQGNCHKCGKIRTHCERVCRNSRHGGEKLREAGVNTMHNKSPACDSRSAGLAECGVRTVKEKGLTLVCYARELHGVTVGKSHVSLLWCVRFAAQIISRSHRGTDGMTGYRRAYGRSRMPRRYVPWSEKVFVEATWVRGFSSESRMNLK